ncbi:MAG: hypothetical protein K0Q51_256 [Rickettsiaceae bacterium]|jgi:hypothetical protein|nr:hypothetical protein [Rickettsiaceae bacterium]
MISKVAFGNVSNLNSIYSMGFNAYYKDRAGENTSGTTNLYSEGGGSTMSAFGNMFENNEDIVQFIQSVMSRSNPVLILVPTLDQIFQTIQSSPFAGLEALGIANFIDPVKLVSGYTLPKPLSPVANQKGQSR